VDDLGLSQGPFPLAGFFRQNMTRMGFGITEFPGCGFFETFGRGSVGFYFRHYRTPLIKIYRGTNGPGKKDNVKDVKTAKLKIKAN
jgi:hypothetical protein